MKYILSLLMCVFCLTSFGQTKKETEDWLNFYLNKYFFFDDVSVNSFPTPTYKYVSRQFFFRANNLVAIAETFEHSGEREDSLISKRVETIDLTKVIKVSYSKGKDSSNYLILECIQDGPQSSAGVMRVNVMNISDETGAYDSRYVLCSDMPDAKMIIPRIIKALNHLIVLDNGKPLKEVF